MPQHGFFTSQMLRIALFSLTLALPAGALPMPEVAHVKSRGGNYAENSPLYAKQQAILKLHPADQPTMQHTNGDPVRRYPIIDTFVLVYWGFWCLMIGIAYYIFQRGYTGNKSQKRATLHQSIRSAYAAEAIAGLKSTGDQEITRPHVDLPENMWALVLAAALGQVQVGSGGTKLGPWLTVLACVPMCMIQIGSLFLIVHDIDPFADPVTTNPTSPFGSPGSVNCMKWVMTFLLLVAMVAEFKQVTTVITTALRLSRKRLSCSVGVPIAVEVMQYLVGLAVIWAGVVVILSFQSVPDIIYSSMAITLISNVDEVVYEGFSNLFDMSADFNVVLAGPTKSSLSKDLHEQEDELGPEQFLPMYAEFIVRVLTLFPALLGAQLFLRALYLGGVPTDRLHSSVAHIRHHVGHSM